MSPRKGQPHDHAYDTETLDEKADRIRHRGGDPMSDTQRLHHLLDRARRGVLLPAEGEQLAGLVTELEADLAGYEEVVGELNEANTGLQRQAANLQRNLNTQRWYAEDRARTGRLQRQRAEGAELRVTTLEAEVARLAAGQCLDSRRMCEQHHTPPVTGCPYPRCVTARQQQETDHA